jgi:hypothetical protein
MRRDPSLPDVAVISDEVSAMIGGTVRDHGTVYETRADVEAAEAVEALQLSEQAGTEEHEALLRMQRKREAAKAQREAAATAAKGAAGEGPGEEEGKDIFQKWALRDAAAARAVKEKAEARARARAELGGDIADAVAAEQPEETEAETAAAEQPEETEAETAAAEQPEEASKGTGLPEVVPVEASEMEASEVEALEVEASEVEASEVEASALVAVVASANAAEQPATAANGQQTQPKLEFDDGAAVTAMTEQATSAEAQVQALRVQLAEATAAVESLRSARSSERSQPSVQSEVGAEQPPEPAPGPAALPSPEPPGSDTARAADPVEMDAMLSALIAAGEGAAEVEGPFLPEQAAQLQPVLEAAEGGDAEAQVQLAFHFGSGQGVAVQSWPRAVK